MAAYRFYSKDRSQNLFQLFFGWGFVSFLCAHFAYAVPVDTKSYDPICGVEVKVVGKILVIGWDTPEGAMELALNLSGQGALVRSVAVASGKGGVGKSTTAVNLAIALRLAGLQVGLLDADVYGPSQPRMLGVSGRPAAAGGDMVKPLENYGIHLMSMGLLVPDDTAMIWRGPMVQSALTQMLDSVAWGVLDVIIIDLPPGTGDIQISLAQQVSLAGAVIVSTPQDIALLDVVKALTMFEKAEVPVLGMVQNMAHWQCPGCGRKDYIFGDGGAAREAEKRGIELLGEIPLSIAVRTGSDSGTPIVVAEPQSEQAKTYRAIAKRLIEVADLCREESE